METARISINEDALTDLAVLSTRIAAAVDSAWSIPGTGQKDISLSFGYVWKVSNGTDEVEFTGRHTLVETDTTKLKSMASTILTAIKAAFATTSYTTFVIAHGYILIVVQYEN